MWGYRSKAAIKLKVHGWLGAEHKKYEIFDEHVGGYIFGEIPTLECMRVPRQR